MATAQPFSIRMVAGLGNPGEEYADTRHNAGFKAIDVLASQAGVSYWKNQAGAEVALINVNDPEAEGGKREVLLVKPQSYMNTSGGPISKLCAQYKVKPEELLVIASRISARRRWARWGFASPLLSLLRRSAICSAAAAHRCSPSPVAAGIRPVPG